MSRGPSRSARARRVMCYHLLLTMLITEHRYIKATSLSVEFFDSSSGIDGRLYPLQEPGDMTSESLPGVPPGVTFDPNDTLGAALLGGFTTST